MFHVGLVSVELGLLTVCHAGTIKPNAVMLTHGMHSLRTLALPSRLCLRLASSLRLTHFVLHVSGRDDLPTLPCVTNCRANGLGR